MNLSDVVLSDSTIRPDAPACPIKLFIVPKVKRGLAYLDAQRRKPMDEATKCVLQCIINHPGISPVEISTRCAIGKNKLPIILHRLNRIDAIEGRGGRLSKRYWIRT